MNELLNWSIALATLTAHAWALYLLLGFRRVRSGALNIALTVAAIVVLVIWYALKANQLHLQGHRWEFGWGVARRMSDPSHWLLVFVALMLAASYVAAITVHIELPKRCRWVAALSVAVVGLIYLGLVCTADSGQTFFYPAPYSSGLKWVQVAEGATNLSVVAGGVLAGLFWIAVFLTMLGKAQREQSPGTAFWVPGILAAMVAGFWAVMGTIRTAVFNAVTDFPLRGSEMSGPNSGAMVFQIVAVLGVIVVVVAASWVLSGAIVRQKTSEGKPDAAGA